MISETINFTLFQNHILYFSFSNFKKEGSGEEAEKEPFQPFPSPDML